MKHFKKKFGKSKKEKESYTPQSQWEKPTWVKENKVIDYLSEDDEEDKGIEGFKAKVQKFGSGQKWVCVSCCSLKDRQLEEEIQNFCEKNGYDSKQSAEIITKWMDFSNAKRSFKVRGCYPDWDMANERVAYLRRVHGANHYIFIGEMGKWLPFDPDPNSIQNQNYFESQMNALHEGWEANQVKAKEHFETRKQELMRKARLEGSKWGQENYMKEKETKEAVEFKVTSADQQIAEFEEKVKEAQRAKQLALEKLEYMQQHPEVLLQPVISIEDVMPSDEQKDVLSKELSKKTQEALAIHREIDANRLPMPENPSSRQRPIIQEVTDNKIVDHREPSVHDVFNDPNIPTKKI
jgi:hypothetical protein